MKNYQAYAITSRVKMRRQTNIEKPYKPELMVDNRVLPYKSITTSALIHRPERPLYSGEVVSQRNPFWITCCGSSEFGVMKLSRREWPGSKVMEIRHHQIPSFENVDRNRYYGLRIGDIVKSEVYHIDQAEVVELVFMDNNAVIVKFEDLTLKRVVAEWMQVVVKVEDR